MGGTAAAWRDGEQLMVDMEGIKLPSVLSAKVEADYTEREILASRVRACDIIHRQEFEIQDACGNKMLTVRFRSVLNFE